MISPTYCPVLDFPTNGGLAPLWHDHYAEEYTLRANLTRNLLNNSNRLRFGLEMKFMEYQWIDISRPWVGAPIQIDENTFSETKSSRVYIRTFGM